MKFIFIVEGYTEQRGVPGFLTRWLNSGNRLPTTVGIDVVNLKGGGKELFDRIVAKDEYYLRGPGEKPQIIAVLGMLDLYNPSFEDVWPRNARSPDEKYEWAVEEISARVNHPAFRMFFAVHEVEAWILSQPENLHVTLSKPDLALCDRPEKINFVTPPSKWLNQRYNAQLRKKYKKVVYGSQMLARLNPDTAYGKCPHLGKMLDEMQLLAKGALGSQKSGANRLRE